MRKIIIELLTIGLILLSTPIKLKGQLFESKELFPKVKTIKIKHFNQSGSGRYLTLKNVDSIGRVKKEERFWNNMLLSSHELKYDNHNNIIVDIQTVDLNGYTRTDTIMYEYKYYDNLIIYQICKLSVSDSTIIKLTKNEGDSILKYQKSEYFFNHQTEKTDFYETSYTLKYKNRLLISNEILGKNENLHKIIEYEYFDNGRLKRKKINWISEPEDSREHVGGIESDDEYFKYDFDEKSRIKIFFKIIDGIKYKIATFKYD